MSALLGSPKVLFPTPVKTTGLRSPPLQLLLRFWYSFRLRCHYLCHVNDCLPFSLLRSNPLIRISSVSVFLRTPHQHSAAGGPSSPRIAHQENCGRKIRPGDTEPARRDTRHLSYDVPVSILRQARHFLHLCRQHHASCLGRRRRKKVTEPLPLLALSTALESLKPSSPVRLAPAGQYRCCDTTHNKTRTRRRLRVPSRDHGAI